MARGAVAASTLLPKGVRMPVSVVADSTCYVPQRLVEDLHIHVVPLSATLGGVTQDEPDIDATGFYRRMRETGEFPTSSQPSPASLIAAFEDGAKRGDEVVGVFISSKMSGTYSTALTARDQVLERFPDARIEIVDSRSNSMEEGFAVLAAARAAAAGGNADACVAAAEAVIDRSRWLFVPATLDYLRMGGRIGAASALVASMLQIHPILTVKNGVTDAFKKVRTFDRAMREIAEYVAADDKAYQLEEAVVHHIDAPEDGRRLADMIQQATDKPVEIIPLGPVVGLHVGPGSLGVVYRCRQPLHKNTEE
jgi:DegV family protein with EDD domain